MTDEETPKKRGQPEFDIFEVALSGLELLVLGVVGVGGLEGVELLVAAVGQTDLRLVVGEQLEVFYGRLKVKNRAKLNLIFKNWFDFLTVEGLLSRIRICNEA